MYGEGWSGLRSGGGLAEQQHTPPGSPQPGDGFVEPDFEEDEPYHPQQHSLVGAPQQEDESTKPDRSMPGEQ